MNTQIIVISAISGQNELIIFDQLIIVDQYRSKECTVLNPWNLQESSQK